MTLSAAVDAGDDRQVLAGCDVVVDFTQPSTVLDNLGWCIDRGLDSWWAPPASTRPG